MTKVLDHSFRLGIGSGRNKGLSIGSGIGFGTLRRFGFGRNYNKKPK